MALARSLARELQLQYLDLVHALLRGSIRAATLSRYLARIGMEENCKSTFVMTPGGENI